MIMECFLTLPVVLSVAVLRHFGHGAELRHGAGGGRGVGAEKSSRPGTLFGVEHPQRPLSFNAFLLGTLQMLILDKALQNDWKFKLGDIDYKKCQWSA